MVRDALRLLPCMAVLLGTVNAFGQVTLSPAAGATGVCPDVPLRLMFPAAPTLGTGVIEIRSVEDDAVFDSINVNPLAAPARAGRFGAAGGVGGAGSATGPNPSFLPLPTRGRTIGGNAGYVYYPILITGNEAAVYLDHPLPYGKAFYVKVPAGAFRVGGADSVLPAGVSEGKGWQFTTKAGPPVLGEGRITVAADESGDFCTVQGAIDFVPAGNTVPTTIFIRKGTYNEIISFSGKNNLTFLGEDRQKTVMAYANNTNFSAAPPQIPAPAGTGRGGGGYWRGMFSAQRVTDLSLVNLTLHNTTAQGGSQAEAIILSGTPNAHAILANVDLYSYQDTLQINGQAYVSNCYIEGDVDFMWGTGPCFFENCHAKTLRNGAYYTQIRNTAANHGYVFKNCTFDGAENITGNVLARIGPATFPASEVVLLDCVVTSAVSPAAWRIENASSAPNVHFWEYNSHTAEGEKVDTTRRDPNSRQLTQPEDAATIANYGDPKWVLGGQWTPALAPIITRQPSAKSVAAGGKVEVTVEVAAVPAATYQWQKNGADVAGATGAAYVIEKVGEGDKGAYTVTVRNDAGTAKSEAATLAVGVLKL